MTCCAEQPGFYPWLHRWAVLTVLVTLPLLFLGAEVTSNHVGMVDPDWPTAPWLLWIASWKEHGFGFLIEHSHRLAGYTVGFCTIVLAVWLWRSEPRRWLCWLGTAALAGVCVQGLLGGLRVRLDALFGPNLALLHGCFGQLVFALLVTLALCTSRRWSQPVEVVAPEEMAVIRHVAGVVIGLVFLQLVLGAVYRHRGFSLPLRGHLLVAFVIVGTVAWLMKTIMTDRPGDTALKSAGGLLLGLVALQVMLGVEAFFVRQTMPELETAPHWLWRRDLVRSAHVLVGSFVLATSVVVSLEARRRTAWVTSATPVAAGRLEGAT